MSVNDLQNKFCRLCLRKNTELNCIFDENDDSIQNDISKYIYLFFAVEVTKSDPYSSYVCKTCWDLIVTVCKYRLKFRKNDAVLRDTTKSSHQNGRVRHVKFKITPRCHESVKKIFVKYKKIKISQTLWGINLDPKVVVKKITIPKYLSQNEDSNNVIIPSSKLKTRKKAIEYNSSKPEESSSEASTFKLIKTEAADELLNSYFNPKEEMLDEFDKLFGHI